MLRTNSAVFFCEQPAVWDFLRLPFECAGQDILKEAQADLVLLTFFQVEVKVLYDAALVTSLTPLLFHGLKQARAERSWVVNVRKTAAAFIQAAAGISCWFEHSKIFGVPCHPGGGEKHLTVLVKMNVVNKQLSVFTLNTLKVNRR